MAGSSVNKSVRGLGATIAFFIGASIALETTSVNRAARRGARGGRRILQCRADAADYTHRLEIEFPAMLRHCLLQHSYPRLLHRPIRFVHSSVYQPLLLLLQMSTYERLDYYC